MEPNEELTTAELRAYQELGSISVPLGLEGLLVEQLRGKNEFNTKRNEKVMKSWIYSVAASIAFFVLGYFVAPLSDIGSSQVEGGELTQYALLLYEDASFIGDDQELVSEYMAWGQDLGTQGKLVGGEKLSYESSWFGENFDKNVAPGILSGFFIIQVSNHEEALAITQTHPHTKYGGRVELREIEKL